MIITIRLKSPDDIKRLRTVPPFIQKKSSEHLLLHDSMQFFSNPWLPWRHLPLLCLCRTDWRDGWVRCLYANFSAAKDFLNLKLKIFILSGINDRIEATVEKN